MIAVHPVRQINCEREDDEIVITQEDSDDGEVNAIRLRAEHVEWLVDALRLLAKEMLE